MWSNGEVSSETVPPPSGTPTSLGGYTVVGRWHSAEGGQVLAAHGPHGEQVELVLMAPGPALDPAARDRFAAAAERLGADHPGHLVEVSTTGPLAWAALRSGSGPELAQPLIEAPLPAGAASAPGSGPAFAPHWSTAPQSYPPPPPVAPVALPAQDPTPWWRRWWLVGLLLLAVVLLLLLLSSCWPRDDAATTPAPTPTPTGSSGPSPTPSPSGSGSPSPGPTGSQGSPAPGDEAQGGPTQRLQAGPGVAGPGFTRDDRTVEMRLAGLPFPFRVPEGWECARDTSAVEPVVRYACTDTTSTGSSTLPPPSGIVQVEPCPGPCGDAEWDTLRNRANDDEGWVLVDPTTASALDVDPELPLYERIRMSRIWSPIGGEMPDTHVYTEFTSPPELFGDVQKITNDIRANTP